MIVLITRAEHKNEFRKRYLYSVTNNVSSKLWACVRAQSHTGREMSAHKKAWSTHTCRSKYRGVLAGKMLHTENFVCTQTLKN